MLSLLYSCTGADHWTVSHLDSYKETSSKLAYMATDAVNGVDVEFLRVGSSLHTYLQVHSQTIPPYNGNPKEAWVTFLSGDQEFSGAAYRHDGGQRLMLTDALQEQLIDALKNQSAVQVRLQGFHTVLETQSFAQAFEKMQAPYLSSPIQLPFKLNYE